jgi:hypothetical protein
MITTITSILIALSLLLGGTGATVYASQDSVPGEFLYRVKLQGEDLQYKWTGDSEGQLKLALRFTARRMMEIQALEGKGEPVGEQVQVRLVERLQENLDTALVAAAMMDDTEQGLEQIKAAIQILKRDCDRIQGNIPQDKEFGLNMFQNMLEYKLQVVEKGLELPLQFKHAFQHRFGKDAEAELLAIAGEEGLEGEAPEDGELEEGILDEIVEEDTTEGPGYGAKNDSGEDRAQGEQTQSSEVKGESYGPGEPQAQPEEPLGPDDGSWGPGQQYGNPDSGNPDSGNQNSGSGGNTDSGQEGKKP